MKSFAIVLLLAVVAAASVASPDAAMKASGEQRWSDARVLWEDYLRANPNDAAGVAELGWAEMELGRVGDAKREFNRALRLKPGLARAYEGLVALALRQYRFEDAIEAASSMVVANPKNAVAERTLGDAYRAASRRSDAEAAYRRAIALDPRDARSHAALGETLLVRRKSDEAAKEYDEAARLEPQNASYREGLGRATLAAGQYGKASVAFADTLALALKSAARNAAAWERIDALTLSLIDALERLALGYRSGSMTRQDVFDANERTQAVVDALADTPSVREADPLTNIPFAQRALAYDLLGQAAAAELDALKSEKSAGAADAVVFREQARRAVVAARAAVRSGAG